MSTRDGRVLLLEDESVNLKLGSVLLKSIGYEPTCAKDGYEVLDLAQSHPFDLILLDIRMPGIDGFEVARRIRERGTPGERIPIVAVSAHAMPGDKRRCGHGRFDAQTPDLARTVGNDGQVAEQSRLERRSRWRIYSQRYPR